MSDTSRPLYEPRGPVLDGIEVATSRHVCCGMFGFHADQCPGPNLPVCDADWTAFDARSEQFDLETCGTCVDCGAPNTEGLRCVTCAADAIADGAALFDSWLR
jgi:hypothetical protein